MCRIWLRQVFVCARVRWYRWGEHITHTPSSLALPFFFPYREKCTLLELFHSTGCSSSKYLDKHFFFFFHLETYTGSVLGQLQNTHTHMETDVFFSRIPWKPTRDDRWGKGGEVADYTQICHSSLDTTCRQQTLFQFETFRAHLPPQNLHPVTINNATAQSHDMSWSHRDQTSSPAKDLSVTPIDKICVLIPTVLQKAAFTHSSLLPLSKRSPGLTSGSWKNSSIPNYSFACLFLLCPVKLSCKQQNLMRCKDIERLCSRRQKWNKGKKTTTVSPEKKIQTSICALDSRDCPLRNTLRESLQKTLP